MPTRLIHVTRQEADIFCRLVETDSSRSNAYATLSYCWGGDQTFKTTLKTITEYKQEIQPKSLPQGLQDAIYVAIHLGLEYIWIDALCIIQDSVADKTIEIALMAKVYGNATVTIAATRSTAVWNGFLGERRLLGAELPDMVFELPCQHVGEELGKLVLIPITFEPIDPLESRAWTFQERVLSNRVPGFGSLRTHRGCQTNIGSTFSDGWSDLPVNKAYGSFGLDA